jgi:hypothetical protein
MPKYTYVTVCYDEPGCFVTGFGPLLFFSFKRQGWPVPPDSLSPSLLQSAVALFSIKAA